ncbi:MAG: ABC transporter permease subunit [Rhodovibrionaceae bacterium]|nr:ABC transporter permease subunit [Rhodovibrionaceae bacterium]
MSAAIENAETVAGTSQGLAQRRLARAALVLVPFLLLLLARPLLPDWAVSWPESLAVPFIDWINAVVEVLEDHAILGLVTFKEITRFIARMVEWPLDLMEGLLISGFDDLGLPAIPWITLVGLTAIFGWWVKGWRLALLSGGCIAYLAIFGKWKLSMVTLSVVLVAAPIAAAIGLLLGIAAVRYAWVERPLWPILNVMQSLPHFSYLIPIAVFIGVSHRAGAIATILFAMPPMARLTILGLRGVTKEVKEAGIMAGCTPRQMLWRVEVPAARPTLMVGVNQVIMQCLAMVVIASFVGAKGLGQDLLFRLQSLRIGQALEIGVAIVFIAIMLDRLSLALSEKQPTHRPEGTLWQRHPYLISALAVVVLSTAAVLLTPAAQKLPSSMTITTAAFWDAVVDYITGNFQQPLSAFRDAALIYVLIPLKSLFQWIPWVAVAALVFAIGWRLAGWRLAALTTSFIVFIALTGYWERASITAYMVFVALLVCVVFGLPLGIWASRKERRARSVLFLCDTFQTFPSFIYLIPVIMLFKVGDVAAIAAIVIYASIPLIRYTIIGLRAVPTQTVEAAITSGCTPSQLLWKVRMPLALPEIMLGVNQTIMFALFMVIIAAFIGTTDLGQEIFRALTFADAGKGLVLGLCVAAMGLTADHLISEWARQRKRELGLAQA